MNLSNKTVQPRSTFFRPLLLLVGVFIGSFAANVFAKGVLLISSSELTGDFQRTIDATVIDLIRESGEDIAVYREDLSMITNFDRFDRSDWVEDTNRKYADAEIDRVVGIGGFSRLLIGETRRDLLPKAIKYEVAGSKVLEHGLDAKTRILSESERTLASLELISTLFPATQKVLLISGDPKTPAQVGMFNESLLNSMRIEHWGLDRSYAEIIDGVAALDPNTVILFSGMLSDRDGERRSTESFITELYEVANRPIFSTWGSALGYGAVGGAFVEPRLIGETIAALILETFVDSSSLLSIKLDHHALERWDLDASHLTGDVEVVNTPEAFLDDVDRVVTYAVAVLGALSAMLIGLGFRSRLMGQRAAAAEAVAVRLGLEKAKSQTLFGVVAHELRTPVSAIAMMTAQSEQVSEHQRDLIYQTTQDLLSTIDDMSLMINPNLSRPLRRSNSSLQAFNDSVNKRVESVISASGMSFEQYNELSEELLQTEMVTDFYRVRVAVSNLIRNACLHSQGSQVLLINRTGEEASSGATYLEWEVRDDGVGIDERDIDRLFLSEQRGDTTAAGSGLGLYITKNLIEELGGEVHYQRGSKRGSRFFVRVPMHLASHSTASADQKIVANEAELSALRVLFVEDEATLRLLGEKLVSKVVAEVDVAVDGQEALDRFDPAYDVVITDYFMPRLDGVALVKTLREQGYNGLVIGVTAATIGDQTDELSKAGCDAVIPKPLTIEKLKQTLSEQLESAEKRVALRA